MSLGCGYRLCKLMLLPKATKALAAWLVQADWVLVATSPYKCGDEVTDAVRLSEGPQTIDSPQL